MTIQLFDLESMKKGWFIGPFEPTALHTTMFECAIKRYPAGACESRHVHRVATEYTVIVEGRVRLNGVEYSRDAIVCIPPGEATDFEALTDVTTVVVKTPAVPGDKHDA